MRVYYNLDTLPEFKNTIFTQGTFDGVHVGHQKILNRLNEVKNLKGGETVLMTFWPHPRLTLFPEDNQLKLLQSLDEKILKIEQCGIDHFIIIPFDKQFSNMSPEEFIEDILIKKLNVSTCVLGYDHRFGKGRRGDINLLKQYSKKNHFEIIEISAESINEMTVSSTKIRTSILNGDVKTAQEYLGSYYQITGKVVHGKKIGRTISFPTANLEVLNPEKLLPKDGVYLVKCLINQKTYFGMLNKGNNPTIELAHPSIEVNIFDFDEEIYGENITVLFIERIRDEKKFKNLEDLALNLQLDKAYAIEKINKLTT